MKPIEDDWSPDPPPGREGMLGCQGGRSWQFYDCLFRPHDPGFRLRYYEPLARYAHRGLSTDAWNQITLVISRLVWAGLALVVFLLAANSGIYGVLSGCVNALVCALLPLLILAPSPGFLAFPAGLTLAPIIVRERTHGTWALLLVSPQPAERLLLIKVQVALEALRPMLVWVRAMQMVVALFIGPSATFVLLPLVLDATGDPATPAQRVLFVMGVAVAMVLLASLFLLDRVQQMILIVMAALAACTGARSERAALISAISVALLAWAAEIALPLALILAQPGAVASPLSLATVVLIAVGPVGGYLLALRPSIMLIAIIVTLIVRESLIAALWRLAHRRAQQI